MAITKFTLVEPPATGSNYTALVESDGGYQPMGTVATTADRKLYTLQYKPVSGAPPRTDPWDMGIEFTGLQERSIDYEILDDMGTSIFVPGDRPKVKDGV